MKPEIIPKVDISKDGWLTTLDKLALQPEGETIETTWHEVFEGNTLYVKQNETILEAITRHTNKDIIIDIPYEEVKEETKLLKSNIYLKESA